jgi:hypothetical protein
MMAFVAPTEANAAKKDKAAEWKKKAAEWKKKKAAQRKKAGGKKGKRGQSQKQFSDDEIYAKMKFTPEQREKFEAALEKLRSAMDKWYATSKGQRLTELEVAADMAKTPEEKRKVADSIGELRQLQGERRTIRRQYEPQVIATLTPKQKAIRVGYKLYNKILAGQLGKELNGQQAGKIESSCLQAGAGIVKGSLSPARAEAQLRSLAVSILTDAQKKKLGVPVSPKKTSAKKNSKRRGWRRR